MSAFEDAVMEVIRGVEPGEVVTYEEVAAEAGHPGAARAVGNLLRVAGGEVPWWRVVGSGGLLLAPDKATQAELLKAEGLVVAGGRVWNR